MISLPAARTIESRPIAPALARPAPPLTPTSLVRASRNKTSSEECEREQAPRGPERTSPPTKASTASRVSLRTLIAQVSAYIRFRSALKLRDANVSLRPSKAAAAALRRRSRRRRSSSSTGDEPQQQRRGRRNRAAAAAGRRDLAAAAPPQRGRLGSLAPGSQPAMPAPRGRGGGRGGRGGGRGGAAQGPTGAARRGGGGGAYAGGAPPPQRQAPPPQKPRKVIRA